MVAAVGVLEKVGVKTGAVAKEVVDLAGLDFVEEAEMKMVWMSKLGTVIAGIKATGGRGRH